MKRRKRKIMAILLAFAMVFTMVDPSIFGGVITAQAEEVNVKEGWTDDTHTTYNITSEDTMVTISGFCNEGLTEYLEANYVLYDDLDFTDNTNNKYHNRINIGSGENHFKGTFDGQGHSITGLSGDAQTAVNNGLFGVMEGATVKNLVIKNADYRSNQYGGILAAQAEDCVIQNVTIIDSSCKVASLGAVVGLITTGGLYGGALVGYAGNTKIYNCESRNTSVYVDTTGGVQALGGDGMYMGGLVGWLDNGGILEYSRVVGGTVSTEYYVAVGALAANNLYAGGLVGRIDGSDATTTQVLDCFSSAKVNYKGECYVSVGAGLSGYAGGIAARISGSNYTMERCHYAGNIHGYLLNSILVLPIIAMEDYYLGGVAGNVEDSSKIKYCYFNWENAIEDNGYPGGPKMPAISGESNTGNVTTIGSAQYSNPEFFEDFDFAGTKERETGNADPFNGKHSNKWVIDPVNNMPIHGKRVEATMDFPGAGTITFAKTSIQEAQTTDTNEKNISQIAQVYEGMNEALTLTATVKKGYNFKGWYKNGALVAGTEESPEYTLTLGGEGGLSYEDNDVYEAKYTANVVFKEMNNGVDETKEYTYKQELNPEDATLSDESYVFLGWSETEYNKEDLQSSMIPDIQFVGKDTSYQVTRPMTLYPVFISITNYNVKVQMESAPLEEDSTYIKGVDGTEAYAEVGNDENGLFINVSEKDVITNLKENEKDKYRFDGWYEISEDNTEGKRISTSKKFYLTNVDLNTEHRYEARYQYKVTTYIPIKTGYYTVAYGGSESEFASYYFGYNDDVNNGSIPKPGFISGSLTHAGITFEHWTNTIEEGKDYDRRYTTFGDQASLLVKEPMPVYAAVTFSNSTNAYFPVLVKSDFPAGTVEAKMDSGSLWTIFGDGSIKATITIKDGYNFKGFWQYYFDEGAWHNPVKTSTLTWNYNEETKTSTATWDSKYGYWEGETSLVARLTADINFHKVGGDITTVERKYNSLLFCADEGAVEDWDNPDGSHVGTPEYEEPGNTVVGTGTTPTNESMYRNGYKFIGWTTDEGIFTNKENYVVSSEAAVSGSLLNVEETRVTETMDVYPVYLEYDITFKTNFDEPEGIIIDSTDSEEEGTVKFKFDSEGYEFASPSEWTVKVDGIEATDVNITFDEETDVYTITGLKTETEYEIIASCTATVTFNNEDGSEVKKDQYDYNQELGELPTPTQEINDQETSIGVNESIGDGVNVFVGWNTGGDSEYVTEENKVTGPMTLEPVYTTPDLNLKSDLEDSGATITVSKTGEVTLKAPEKDGYDFAGWKWSGKESETITVEANEDGTYVYELTPEEAREGGTYTAKYNPIVTYTIPKVENDTLTEGEPVTGSVPYGSKMGEVIDLKIVEATNEIVAALKGTDYVFEGKWSKDSWTGEECTDPITEQTTLYPIITKRTEEQVTIYSNIDDSNAVVDMSRKDGKVTFPEEETLPEGIVKEGASGINGEPVNAEFVGYSLVFIVNNEDGTETKRVSDALYAPGDTIDADEITAYNGEEDERHQIARVYAVWAQVQTIPEGSMYFGGGTPSFANGLFSAVAVNTKILTRAGLQTGNECSYDRSMTYTLGKNTPIVTTAPRNVWDNDLYKSYFDNSFESDTWDIYTSVLYNLSKSLYNKKINISPALKFTYADKETKSITGETVAYSHQDVALELLERLEAGKEGYTWENYETELAKYAGQ